MQLKGEILNKLITNENNKMFKIKVIVLVLSSMLIISNCEKDKNPLGINLPDTTSHNYEWVVDTLSAPDAMQILMSDIWGTDENNVWLVGHSDDCDYQIWHWDGESWENIDPEIYGDSPSYMAICGFSKNNIWIVGDGVFRVGLDTKLHYREYILHYNGTNWERIKEFKAPSCLSVWGTSSDNLFIGCDSGFVLYKDQNGWDKQQTSANSQIMDIYGLNEYDVYAIGYSCERSTYYFYKYNERSWIAVDSINTTQPNWNWRFGFRLWGIDQNSFYSAGEGGIYKYNNNEWQPILQNYSFRVIYGNKTNNIFAAALFNHIYHYNGMKWKRDPYFDNFYFDVINGIWCNDDFVFITAQNGYLSFIFRGIKKERR
jgi:hypothetical protein